MRLILNGDEVVTYCSTLEDFCLENKYDLEIIATAMNGIFVPKDLRINTILEEGDQIDILAPLQGG